MNAVPVGLTLITGHADVGLTLYKCYTNVLCLLGSARLRGHYSNVSSIIEQTRAIMHTVKLVANRYQRLAIEAMCVLSTRVQSHCSGAI